jgi:prepilin-type N-terminal cleavage/methylation domain-containing protein
MGSSLLTIRKSYSLDPSGQASLAPPLLISSQQAASSRGGFTLVELLVVVVILGVLGAVGIPAYFAQTRTANINSANQAVLAAAKACAAAQVTGEARNFNPGRGVLVSAGRCDVTSANVDFRSEDNRFTSLNTQDVARVAGSTGEVTLVTSAN